MNILIVDDESSVREVLQLCLERLGYHVRCASCAVEAFALLEEFLPDVVLCDLHLGDMNGIDFSITISDLLPPAKIFLMTGDAPPISSSSKITVVEKPISIRRLTSLIGPPHASAIVSGMDLATRVKH